MRGHDTLRFAWRALTAARWRALLMLLAMAIGVAAVVILTALGEGARRFVVEEFTSLGTHLVIVVPGRTETAGGGLPLMVGEIARDLTLDDAQALARHPGVVRVAPLTVGTAALSWQGKTRDTPVLGSTATLLQVRHWALARGQFLPAGDAQENDPVVVIGAKVKSELFGNVSPLGEWLRLGERRYRVIGVLASEGRSIGVDVEEVAIIPVIAAQQLFNNASLFRILIETRSYAAMQSVRDFTLATLKKRHQGEADVTVVTQDAVLATFDKILRALTLAVGGIAAISLAVAGILIMNVMLIAVAQRTSEVGLLKALGASALHIQHLFLAEAALLSLGGALLGLIIGKIGCSVITLLYPTLVVVPPLWALFAAVGTALGTGLLFGVLPARRAAKLDPVIALTRR
ncbi:MAG: hypothetical protein FD130_587 [Halothiobacillaceae bacterium]|nr:MAG: hypothetical protein FD130_587 [Halothiobacillaceae bacterium]